MKEELGKYINGEGYYNWGVQLLRKLGHDSREVARFERYCVEDFAPLSLISDLNRLLKDCYEKLEPKNSLVIQKETTQKRFLLNDKKDEPQIITDLRREEKQLRNDRRALHATLDDTPDDEERGEKCCTIRSLTGRINQIWLSIFAFEKDGSLPALGAVAEEKTGAEEAVELSLRRLTLRPRLTRLKKMLEDPNLPTSKKIRYVREQGEKEAELKLVEHKLSTIKNK